MQTEQAYREYRYTFFSPFLATKYAKQKIAKEDNITNQKIPENVISLKHKTGVPRNLKCRVFRDYRPT